MTEESFVENSLLYCYLTEKITFFLEKSKKAGISSKSDSFEVVLKLFSKQISK